MSNNALSRWDAFVDEQQAIESLRAFYGVQSDRDLVIAQAKHIERLQAKLLPIHETPVLRSRA